MRPPPLLVCERSGRWAAALRRAFVRRQAAVPPRVVETRSPQELRRRIEERRLRGRPAAPWVAELPPAETAAICELLAWHVAAGAEAPAAIVAEPEAAGYEAAVRTAGAGLFVASLRQVDEIAAMYERYRIDLSHRPIYADDDRTPDRRLWDELPWGDRLD